MLKKVGLFVKDSKASLKLSEKIDFYLSARGIDLLFDPTSAERLGTKRSCRIEDMDVDLLIVLGGDGMILRTASLTAGRRIPIFGINFGETGFLAEGKPREWEFALEKIVSGEYSIDERRKVEVRINSKKMGEALNEVVIMTSLPVKMLNLQITINSSIAETAKADGLIVSTPTGSTAYSLSCGGPIVDPRVNCFIITYISPFKLGARSLVVPGDSEAAVRLIKTKKDAVIVADGSCLGKLTPGEYASFKISKNKAYFINLGEGFYKRIRERL